MPKYTIGIDTSCYTTSVVILDIDKLKIIDNFQKILMVKKGSKGLRQSEAFFQHVNNLGEYFNRNKISFKNVESVCVSTRPRNLDNSYMPVFLAGENFAKTIANILDKPLVKTDHQTGHLLACFYSNILNGQKIPNKFLGLHLSGGTTEILDCKKLDLEDVYSFKSQIIGGTLDLCFGQLIDRIGVKLGFDFPCGAKMEEFIHQSFSEIENRFDFKNIIDKYVPNIQKKSYFNLSGYENKFNLMIEDGIDSELIIYTLFYSLANQLICSLELISMDFDLPIVLSGGVASNGMLYKFMYDKFGDRIIRAEKNFCRDNALGVALSPLIKQL